MAVSAVAMAFVCAVAYTVPEVAYIARANALLSAIQTERAENGMVAVQRLCPKVKTFADGPVRICAEADFFHPYHDAIAWSELNSPAKRRFGVNLLIPRFRTEPFEVLVVRDVSADGHEAHLRKLPNDEFTNAAMLYLQRDAKYHLRLKYRCFVPLVRCESFAEVIHGE